MNPYLTAFAAAAAVAVLGFAADAPGDPDEAARVARYLEYARLTRLTEKQIDVAESVQGLCSLPSTIHGPHIRPGIHIYANAAVLETPRVKGKAPRYPVGALLVKEKFTEKDKPDAKPDLITVMEKTADTGKVDDWRFTMIRLAGNQVVREREAVTCAECHGAMSKTGFVSRETDGLLEKLAAKAKKPGGK